MLLILMDHSNRSEWLMLPFRYKSYRHMCNRSDTCSWLICHTHHRHVKLGSFFFGQCTRLRQIRSVPDYLIHLFRDAFRRTAPLLLCAEIWCVLFGGCGLRILHVTSLYSFIISIKSAYISFFSGNHGHYWNFLLLPSHSLQPGRTSGTASFKWACHLSD